MDDADVDPLLGNDQRPAPGDASLHAQRLGSHAFVQNLRRGHYELGDDARPALRVAAAFTELAQAL
jgi:IS6 family transposase